MKCTYNSQVSDDLIASIIQCVVDDKSTTRHTAMLENGPEAMLIKITIRVC